MIHFLVLVAFFQITEIAPRFVAVHTSADECWIAAQKKNHDDAARALGLHYACVVLVSDT